MIRDLTFRVHCRRHSDDVYRYARSILGNSADAEDATQEVLLKLWNHLPKIKRTTVRSWLLSTTRNHCIDQIRRRKPATFEISDEVLHGHADTAADPSKITEVKQLREHIDAALLKLPETLRSVFVLYEVNGLRYREIAETLDLPINSVKVHLSRARKKLQQLLTNQQESWTQT